MSRALPRWPLYLIAAPAAVAVWSGWVGIGTLCGFGVIHPLPGVWDAATLNTAITLPIGVEAYGAYAMGAWLSPGVPASARRFAKWSAIGSLALGMLGQVAYHLLNAAHAARAPWPVVVLVSSLPVIVLGFGAALSHLLRGEDGEPHDVPGVNPEAAPAVPESEPAPVPVPVSESAPGVPTGVPRSANRVRVKPVTKRAAKALDPVALFADDLARGEVPSLRRIRAALCVGQPRAQAVKADLEAIIIKSRAPVAA